MEQTGVAIVAAIFTLTTARALRSRQFTYHFGPTICRTERPVEYWIVTLLFLSVTCLLWTILVLISTGHLQKWAG